MLISRTAAKQILFAQSTVGEFPLQTFNWWRRHNSCNQRWKFWVCTAPNAPNSGPLFTLTCFSATTCAPICCRWQSEFNFSHLAFIFKCSSHRSISSSESMPPPPAKRFGHSLTNQRQSALIPSQELFFLSLFRSHNKSESTLVSSQDISLLRPLQRTFHMEHLHWRTRC